MGSKILGCRPEPRHCITKMATTVAPTPNTNPLELRMRYSSPLLHPSKYTVYTASDTLEGLPIPTENAHGRPPLLGRHEGSTTRMATTSGAPWVDMTHMLVLLSRGMPCERTRSELPYASPSLRSIPLTSLGLGCGGTKIASPGVPRSQTS